MTQTPQILCTSKAIRKTDSEYCIRQYSIFYLNLLQFLPSNIISFNSWPVSAVYGLILATNYWNKSNTGQSSDTLFAGFWLVGFFWCLGFVCLFALGG